VRLAEEICAFIEQARVAHLATASRDGRPHVVPVCFALLDRSTLVFAIDDKPKAAGRVLKRLRNLAENDRFAVVVDRWDEDWRRLAYVMLTGRGHVCEDLHRRRIAIDRLRERYPQYREMNLDPARHAVVELALERAHTWGPLG
jgi:PPOX class probable F420-dependent enzyme